MPSTTRSSIRFPSSKQAVAPAKSSSSSTSKPDAITLLFRREVQSLLSTPPALPSHIPADTPVEVVACVERLSLSGIQQSVQLCQAGGETWVTRTEGARHYFPRTGRVQKRLRGNEEEDNEDVQEGGARDREMDEDTAVRGKKSKKSRSRREDQGYETPKITSSSSSGTRRRSPAAPQKEKRHRRTSRRREERQDDDGEEGEDFDDGASTETEGSHLARTRGSRNPGMLTSIGEETAEVAQLGRGQRRCAGRNTTLATTEEGAGLKVKAEESDDLASLCGRVDGLEFRGTVDPESEYERTPVPASDVKGKGRA